MAEAALQGCFYQAEAEAAETQVWLEFAVKGKYLNRDEAAALYKAYAEIIRTIVGKTRIIPKSH